MDGSNGPCTSSPADSPYDTRNSARGKCSDDVSEVEQIGDEIPSTFCDVTDPEHGFVARCHLSFLYLVELLETTELTTQGMGTVTFHGDDVQRGFPQQLAACSRHHSRDLADSSSVYDRDLERALRQPRSSHRDLQICIHIASAYCAAPEGTCPYNARLQP
ncbi:hypothetical protein J6590_050642 [Homalodisca vitripennis]|nr:hypothetical protein J6590_050642 [Homalodisca vitripennis]